MRSTLTLFEPLRQQPQDFFAREVIRALYTFRLLDEVVFDARPLCTWAEVHFFRSYLEYRIMLEPLNGNRFLNDIRNVALQISSVSDVPEVDESIIKNVVHILCATVLVSRSSIDRWRQESRRASKWDSAELEKHLFGAALCTNTLSYIRRSSALRDAMVLDPNGRDNSCLFGHYVELAAKHGNEVLLGDLMTSGASGSSLKLRFHLFKFAAKAGRLEIVRFLYNVRNEDWPWNFERQTYARDTQLDTIVESVHDPQVWDYIETVRIARGMRPIQSLAINRRIYNCARLGFLDMASFLVRADAHTEDDRGQYSFIHQYESDHQVSCDLRDRSVWAASRRGSVAIVELLLDDGAKSNHALEGAARHGQINVISMLLDRGVKTSDALVDVGTGHSVPAKLLAKAERGPHLDVVRLLLDAGVDVNESIGKESPLAKAVATEHTALFEFLLERGADLHSPGTAEECVRQAKKDGSESMLLLLEKHGVDVNAHSAPST